MKTTAAIVLALLTYIVGHTQKIEKYYNYNWKECDVYLASFYTVIEKTDSGWSRNDYFVHRKKLQMKALYQDSSCQVGITPALSYYPNGYLESSIRTVNGKRQGWCYSFHSNGMLEDSSFFVDGDLQGVSQKWSRNGLRVDSAFYNADGSGIEYEWFDDGTPSGAGRYSSGYKKAGKWAYYHHNGQISSIESYLDDQLQDVKLFSENGTSLSDTSGRMIRSATFPGGPEAWSKYLNKNLYFPEEYRIVNGQVVVVVVRMTVYEDGSIHDVDVEVPFHPDFEKIALNAVKRSPKWNPAILHNRPVKYAARITVSFDQNNNY